MGAWVCQHGTQLCASIAEAVPLSWRTGQGLDSLPFDGAAIDVAAGRVACTGLGSCSSRLCRDHQSDFSTYGRCGARSFDYVSGALVGARRPRISGFQRPPQLASILWFKTWHMAQPWQRPREELDEDEPLIR